MDLDLRECFRRLREVEVMHSPVGNFVRPGGKLRLHERTMFVVLERDHAMGAGQGILRQRDARRSGVGALNLPIPQRLLGVMREIALREMDGQPAGKGPQLAPGQLRVMVEDSLCKRLR